jgi:hypothetical protein
MEMERASINGQPIWASMIDFTAGERLVVKEAAGVDGGSVESQGQLPQRFKLDFTLIRDGKWITADYETATLDLRAMLLGGGPFTIRIPTFGELTGLWIEGTYTLTFFDGSQRGISYGSLTLTDLDPIIILQESAAAQVTNAVAALSLAAFEAFGDAEPELGFGDAALAELDALFEWMDDVQGAIAAAFQPINDVSGAIASLSSNVQQLIQAPQNFASQVIGTAASLLSLVPSLASSGSTTAGSAAVQDPTTDKPAVVYEQALDLGTEFDSELPELQGETIDTPSEEDLAEIDEVNAVKSLAYTTVTASVCLAIVSTNFATVNSVLLLAESLEAAFEALFNLEGVDYKVFSAARQLRAATRSVLSSSATALPRLRTFTCPRDTDLFDVLPDIYPSERPTEQRVDELQLAVDQLAAINDIEDPSNIIKGTVLQYLDPLVS